MVWCDRIIMGYGANAPVRNLNLRGGYWNEEEKHEKGNCRSYGRIIDFTKSNCSVGG